MKKTKLIIAILICISILFIFSLSAYAEEDYNNVIAINLNGSNVIIPTYGLNTATWSSYVQMYEKNNEDNLLFISNGYVLYNNHLLKNKNGDFVKANDQLIVAAGCIYDTYSIISLYQELPYGIVFSNYVHGWTFGQLISLLNDCNIYTFSQGGYITLRCFYNSSALKKGTAFISPNDIIADVAYSYDSDKCQHMFRTVLVYSAPTCITEGSAQVGCRLCGYHCDQVLPPDDNHHFEDYIDYVDSTCVNEGYITAKCINCNEIITQSIVKKQHSFTVPTCTEDSICSECSLPGASALGHDLNALGFCKRDGCDYSTVKNALNNTSTWFGDIFGNAKDKIDSIDDKVNDHTNGIKKDINNTLDKALLIIGGIIFAIALVYLVPVGKKMYKKIFAKKQNIWENRRR